MGAGKVGLAIKILHDRFRNDKTICFIVICGSNKKLYSFINKHYSDNVIPLEFTGDIAKYMKASDIFISKTRRAVLYGSSCFRHAPYTYIAYSRL